MRPLCSLAMLALTAPGAEMAGPRNSADAALMAYLRQQLHVAEAARAGEPQTRVAVAWADLEGDGREEALVYVTGDGWCGSGGCKLMVLEPQGAGFKVRANTTITWLPIGLLATRGHGWRDITVTYAGGGVDPGYVAVLRFNGTRYPEDPNPPAPRLPHGARPSIVIPETDEGVILAGPSSKPPRAR